jgi:glutamate-5-semialdehyde dehydrogenase
METLLVHVDRSQDFLPRALEELQRAGVTLRGCQRTRSLGRNIEPVTEENFRTEYLAKEMNVRVVDSFEEAADHIANYGSAHTDAIITRDYGTARRFVREVDSASVMVNASTRLSDGGVYGLGAEIGISTDKIHARGPMGIQELTTTKFVVLGEGHLRE